MKKIINGKVYDTGKATFVARADHENIIDATGNTCKQALYRKKTGEFFVHLESGTSITLHNIFQHDYRQGRGIYPLSYDQAAKWAESELTAEKWEEIFGDPEDDEDITICIRISATAAAKLKREAAKNGITQAAQIEKWISEAELKIAGGS